MTNYTINGNAMTDRGQAHDELARALEFPAYYGRNLDALWDLATELAGEVTLENTAQMLNSLGTYGCQLLEVLYEAAQKNPNLTFLAR